MNKRFLLLSLVFMLVFMLVTPAHADAAPPEPPPGSNIDPDSELTQVRMVAETVTLTVSEDPVADNKTIAKTEAVFTMRNLGATEEKLNVRFPLSFLDGNSNGYGQFPEIQSIEVKVNGETVPTQREMQPYTIGEPNLGGPKPNRHEREEIPWAVFEVVFPPNQDVTIEVVYDVQGFGIYPYQAFKYVIETGVGWNGTIGSADVILRLPYETNKKNVWVEDVGTGYLAAWHPPAGGVFSGNEVRWKFENLEPTFENNMVFVVVTPSVWESILIEMENTSKNPNDGEAWCRLADLYQDVVDMSHYQLRSDASGIEIFESGVTAYEKCLSLLPDDPSHYYQYANLLWLDYFNQYLLGQPDTRNELGTMLQSLQTALELDPNFDEAKRLLADINFWIPEAVQQNEDGSFTLLGLTATPIPPTPWGGDATPTALPTPTVEFIATPTKIASPAPSEPTKTSNPLCGSAAMILLVFGLVTGFKRKTTK